MNRLRTLRTAAVAVAAAALIAPALVALAGPAGAGSVKRHDVNLYKVEGFVELSGEYPDNEVHEHLYCKPGDVALHGMWKVDSYETPNASEGVTGDTRSVFAHESWGDNTLPDKWHFWFDNLGTGRATIKTFVTCVTPETGLRNGHSHDITVTRHANLNKALDVDGKYVFDTPCPSGTVPVAPGYNLIGGTARLTASYPDNATNTWVWKFDQLSVEAAFDFYLRCLKVRVSNETGNGDTKAHTHELDLQFPALSTFHIGSSSREITTLAATPKDFAAVGAFKVVTPDHVTFLGMDARGRKRDFVTFNATSSGNHLEAAVLSFDKRTSPQLKP